MKTVAHALFGWLVPGGAYLLKGRYRQFAIFAVLVCATFAAGVALHGSWAMPEAPELQGLAGLDALMARAGAFTRVLAGAPFLVAQLLAAPESYLDGRLHEYGTTLLTMAGMFNALALAGALELHRPEPRRPEAR